MFTAIAKLAVAAIAVAIASAMPFHFALAQSATRDIVGWQQARWGMSRAEVRSVIRGDWRQNQDAEDQLDRLDAEVGGLKSLIVFEYSERERKLQNVWVSVDDMHRSHANYVHLRDALYKFYGQGGSSSEVLRNEEGWRRRCQALRADPDLGRIQGEWWPIDFHAKVRIQRKSGELELTYMSARLCAWYPDWVAKNLSSDPTLRESLGHPSLRIEYKPRRDGNLRGL